MLIEITRFVGQPALAIAKTLFVATSFPVPSPSALANTFSLSLSLLSLLIIVSSTGASSPLDGVFCAPWSWVKVE